MAIKVFINYRRDDARSDAARLRDRLVAKLGKSNVFMDVDDLRPGQRFDRELEKALAKCEVFLAVIGSRWYEILQARVRSGEQDFVRQEIAAALKRDISIIPVTLEQASLPLPNTLPADIRNLVLHQRHVIAHERFGRDADELLAAIKSARHSAPGRAGGKAPARDWLIAAAIALLLGGLALAAPYVGIPVPWLSDHKPLNLVEERSLRPSDSFKECRTCPAMVVVPAGAFMMGSNESPNTQPVHEVTIRKPFAVGKYEVAFAEYDACVADGGCGRTFDYGFGRGDRPVLSNTWASAKAYTGWLSRKTGRTYRLLTEAEWEYAARAGSTTRYYWGDDLGSGHANCCGSQWDGKQTAPVGSFPPNAFGLHDMIGNAAEWVEDCYYDNYRGAPSDGSARPRRAECEDSSGGKLSGTTTWHVLRGGSWNYSASSAYRLHFQSSFREDVLGFRVARTLN